MCDSRALVPKCADTRKRILRFVHPVERARLRALDTDAQFCDELHERDAACAAAPGGDEARPCAISTTTPCKPAAPLTTRHFEWRRATLKYSTSTPRMTGLYLRTSHTGPDAKARIASEIWSKVGATAGEQYDRMQSRIMDTPRRLRMRLRSPTDILHPVHVKWEAPMGGVMDDESVSIVDLYDVDSKGTKRVVRRQRWVRRLKWKARLVFISRKHTNEPGHAVLLASRLGRVYAYDPNGKELYIDADKVRHNAYETSAHPVVVVKAIRAVCAQMGWPLAPDWHTIESSWLLDRGMGQDGVVLYLNSQGICGAFAAYVMTLLVLNPLCSAKELQAFVRYRKEQWQDEPVSDARLRESLIKMRTWSTGELSAITLRMMSLHALMEGAPHCWTARLQRTMEDDKSSLKDRIDQIDAEKAARERALRSATTTTAKRDATAAWNSFVDRYNEEQAEIQSLVEKYNRLVEDKNRAMKLENLVKHVQECEDTDESVKDYVYDTVWNLFQTMKIESEQKVHIRKKMVDNAIFLNFLEVQIFAFIAFCDEY